VSVRRSGVSVRRSRVSLRRSRAYVRRSGDSLRRSRAYVRRSGDSLRRSRAYVRRSGALPRRFRRCSSFYMRVLGQPVELVDQFARAEARRRSRGGRHHLHEGARQQTVRGAGIVARTGRPAIPHGSPHSPRR
jgi:hypothetical protein